MTSSERVVEVFDRLIKEPRVPFEALPFADQVVYCSIVVRCEKDTACFFSIFEQGLTDDQIEVFIRGLRRMNQEVLAEAFERSMQILQRHNFYPRDKILPESAYQAIEREIEAIGEQVGDRLWDLDDDLVKLLNEQ
jgi:hypothetical protein